MKDMIIRGGENHFPAEIEAVLVTHSDVAQVAMQRLQEAKERGWGHLYSPAVYKLFEEES